MPKTKTIYVCDKCGYESPKWFGRCPVCGEWNSAKEFQLKDASTEAKNIRSQDAGMMESHPRFFDLHTALERSEEERIKTNIPAVDQLLNGGLVRGQVVLLGGEPGVGKSTLALQICDATAKSNEREDRVVYYISGEESVQQVASRAKRLGIKNPRILISSETQIEDILSNIDPQKARLIVIDSIQTPLSGALSR
jgi:DNA repair protein RadA/Sms